MKNKSLKGFTLIELLIVIGIISILAGIVLVAVNPAVQFGKANDSERKSEIGSILGAVYQYQTAPSSRGSLPQCLTGAGQAAAPIPTCDPDASGAGVGNGAFEGALELGTLADATHYNCSSVLAPNYLREMPIDPNDNLFNATQSGYHICQETINSVTRVYVIAEGAEVYTDDGGCEFDSDPGVGVVLVPAMCVSS